MISLENLFEPERSLPLDIIRMVCLCVLGGGFALAVLAMFASIGYSLWTSLKHPERQTPYNRM